MAVLKYQRARQLMHQWHNIFKVASILHERPARVYYLLNYPKSAPEVFPGRRIAKLYKEGHSITAIHIKTGVPVHWITQILKTRSGYKTFDELNGKVKYNDLTKQAVFIAQRDLLIAELYKHGWDIDSLSMEFGLAYRFIRAILEHAGFKFGRP